MAQRSSRANSGSSSRGVRREHEARPFEVAPIKRHLLRGSINGWNKGQGMPKEGGGTQQAPMHTLGLKLDDTFQVPP